MSKVDDLFIEELKEVLNEDFEIDNRAKWDDKPTTETKRILQVFRKWDLNDGFPILTLRDINWKLAIDEVVWIYIKKSNNVKDLNSSIWNQWKNENGEIEKAYGYQIAKPTMGYNSQIEYVINEIKKNPTSRRIQMNMFNAEEQEIKAKKSLIECAYATHFSVKNGKLHMTLIQRSGDLLTAAGYGSWNMVQYAFLQHAIAKECNLKVGYFAHFIEDLHVYDSHVDQCKELIRRYEEETIPQNKVQIKIADKPFFELTADDVKLIGYENLGSIGKIKVAK